MVAGASLAFPCLPLSLSLPCSLSRQNSPAAVLMVTLSAKSEGLDFTGHTSSALHQRWMLCSQCLSASLLHLHLPFILIRMLHFFLLARPNISLFPLSVPTSPRLIYQQRLLPSQPSHLVLLMVFHHPEIPTMTGLYQLACLNLTPI